MSQESRMFSKGELAGAVVAALAVGFFMGSMFMELRMPKLPPGGMQGMSQQGAPGGPSGGQDAHPELMAQIGELEMSTAKNPADQTGWVDLGNLYFDTHQPQKAIAAYGKAIALGPVSPDVWTDLGIMHREAGQTPQALAAFEKAIGLDPNHVNALYNKGVVQLHDAKDRAGAAATWTRLVKLNPQAKTPEGRLVRDLLTELGKG